MFKHTVAYFNSTLITFNIFLMLCSW